MKRNLLILSSVILFISLVLGIYDLKYAFGLSMALFIIILTTKREKDLHDENKAKETWSEFFDKNWDDFSLTWLAAIVLVSLQGYAFQVYSEYAKWDYNYLYDKAGQYMLAAALGWFSDTIVDTLYSKRKSTIDNLTK